MAVSVSLINMKGGVGKTTLAAQLAFAAARRNLRTLAVDLDPQANLSQALLSPEEYGQHLREEKPTIVQIFDQYFPPTGESGSPRPFDLSAVAKVTGDYDLILIDCAPTESILTKAAYHASRYVLVPVKPEYLATIGLPLLARSLQTFKDKNARHALDICGIVFNHPAYSIGPEGVTSIREVQAEATENGWHVFETQVRYSRSYAKAAREGRSIGLTSNVHWYVAGEFSQFVDEFLPAIGITQEEQ